MEYFTKGAWVVGSNPTTVTCLATHRTVAKISKQSTAREARADAALVSSAPDMLKLLLDLKEKNLLSVDHAIIFDRIMLKIHGHDRT